MVKLLKGAVDKPVTKLAEDKFGLAGYVKALSTVIKECQTPMTISIQGDWGSGKTSFMSLVEEELAKDTNIEYMEFNTWQYSKFNMDDQLALNLLNSLAKKLVGKDAENKESTVLNSIAKLCYATYMLADVQQSRLTGIKFQDLKKEDIPEQLSIADEVKDLKAELSKASANRNSRKVIFIDDLDRLEPKKAVELLEVLQIFMTVENCVFVLAVDYEVVVQGFKEKMGSSYSTLKSKNFFDKIIQLPFTIPVGLASGEKAIPYVEEMLRGMGIYDKASDNLSDLAAEFVDIIGNSIGFNPRKVKRIMNGYWLLKLVIVNNVSDKIQNDKLSQDEIDRALFYILCMQMAYEEAYNFIVSNYKNTKKIDKFISAIIVENEEEGDQESDLVEVQTILKEIRKDGVMYERRFQAFLNKFTTIFMMEENEEETTKLGQALLVKVLDLSMTTANTTQQLEEKIGAYVQRTIQGIDLPAEEIVRCQTAEYTKKTFNQTYPLFIDATNMSEEEIKEKKSPDGRVRYYKNPIKINDRTLYYTSQWIEKHREPYMAWLEKFGNSIV